jgi:hypothetical protein
VVGLIGDRHGDHGPLAHPTGELVGILVDTSGRVGDADDIQQIGGQLPLGRLAHGRLVGRDGFGDLVADGEDRVEGGQGVLEHHGQPTAPQFAPVILVHVEQVLAAEDDLPGDLGRLGQEPHDRQGADALAGTGLADDPDDLVGVDVVAHPIDRLDHAVVGLEADLQISDREQGLARPDGIERGEADVLGLLGCQVLRHQTALSASPTAGRTRPEGRRPRS